MTAGQFAKILRDLLQSRGRTLLTILALAVGIAGVGSALGAWTILSREIHVNYSKTNPADIVITTDADEPMVDELRREAPIADIETRTVVRARYRKGENEWIPALIFASEDFTSVRIDRFYPESGVWPVRDGEILIERAALNMVLEMENTPVVFKLESAPGVELVFSGQAYAPGLAPAWMEGMIYGYVTMNTLKGMGYESAKRNIHIVLKNPSGRAENSRVAGLVAQKIKAAGFSVDEISVPTPGKHPHAGQMNSLLFLIQVLGWLLLALSCVLVVNLVSEQISRQVRQIGIMKVLGGGHGRIASMYVLSVALIGAAGCAAGIPAGRIWGNFYADTFAKVLNFEISSYALPSYVIPAQIAAGVLLPVLASLYPIFRAAGYTVVKALTDHGIAADVTGRRKGSPVSERVLTLNRPLMLSIRNAFRKKERLVLTVATLALGGAIFIVAMNFRDSLVYTVERVFDTMNYDVQLTLDRDCSGEELEALKKAVPEIADIHIAGAINGSVVHDDGSTGESFAVTALPLSLDLVTPIMARGNFLSSEDSNEIVINHVLQIQEKAFRQINPGDTVNLNVNGRQVAFTVTGIAREPVSPPRAFISYKNYLTKFGGDVRTQNLFVVMKDHSAGAQIEVAKKIEKYFAQLGVSVRYLARTSYYKKIIDDHLFIIFLFLLFVSLLTVVVGGIGLAICMSVNVMERTREFGVLRTIGAGRRTIFTAVMAESVVVALISWIFAVIAAPPLSMFEADIFGKIFFGTGLDVRMSLTGSLVWLLFSVAVAALSALYPAYTAVKMSIGESLRYE